LGETIVNKPSEDEFPEADVHEGGNVAAIARHNSSWLWGVTGVCLIVAVALFVTANHNRGPQISVQFQQGHGIKPGDSLRHRGIEVGRITSVKLNKSLDTLIVNIALEPAAAGLAREGSRFWIERPRFSLSRISGLETVVGAKYLSVVPGDVDAPPQFFFDGLEVVPTTIERSEGGLDITLEAKHRRGIRPGAPVLYRGHKVGQVVSLGLSPDASQVEVRTYVEPAFKRLIRDNTVFWSTSGVKANFSISGGFEVTAETLETIAAGGISLATPDTPGQLVHTGHRFALLNKRDNTFNEDEWTSWQPHISLGSIEMPDATTLPQPVRATIAWREKRLGLTRSRQREGWILALADNRLLGPADLFVPSSKAIDNSAILQVAGHAIPIDRERVELFEKLAMLQLDEPLQDTAVWQTTKLRRPDAIEEAFVLAESAESSFPIPASRLTVDPSGNGWNIASSFSINPHLHGACVVSSTDGAILGLLVVNSGVAHVAFAK
jgi:paraquat-inducible protein B